MADQRRQPANPIALAFAAAIREIAARREAERLERRRRLGVVGAEERKERVA